MDSTKVEPAKSRRRSVTIKDVEDEDVQNMMNKPKLCEDTTHIVEDLSDDEHIMFDCMNYKEKRDSAPPSKESKRKPYNVPVMTGRKFERPRMPDIHERNVPTLHSNLYKYKGPSQREEVLLAVMDANLNELNESKEELPDLRKKWVESAMDILTGAPPHLPPLREVNHKIPLIDESKQYNYYLPRCPEALKTQLIDKIQLYKEAGWWEETNVSQAAPMLCVYKKDSAKLRTIKMVERRTTIRRRT